MSEAVSCLVRVDDNVRKNRLIKLDREQITVGRSGDVDCTILSTMISRCHAVFKQQDGKWTITDNKSLNGVYVNGRQLTPFKACIMEDGDMVQFGVPMSPDIPAEFLYKYHESLKVRINKDGAKRLREDSENRTENAASKHESDEEVAKRKKLEPSSSRVNDNPEKVTDGEASNASSKEAEYQARLAHMERLLHEKEMKHSEVEKQLEKEKQEREKRMKEVEELRLKEQAFLLEMQDKQVKLEKEKEELKQQMQAELKANLQEKEQALVSQLADQKQSLIEEKKRIEEILQNELAKALEVKNKEVEERLVSMKENLEKVIEKKDNDQKLLEMRLNETKEENETAKLQALKAREDVLSDFVDLMEMELQCTICNELFIKATALNCAHVFCKLCINQWMKVKKECPNCRMKITSHMQAIALDSYIEKMVEQLSDDHKESRKALLEQRKVEQDKMDAGPSTKTAPVPVPGLPLASADTRGRGRNRGGRNNRGRGRNARGRGGNVTGAHAYTTPPQAIAVTTPLRVGATTTGVHAAGRNVRGAYATATTTAMNVTGPYTRRALGISADLTNPIIMTVGALPQRSAAAQARQTVRPLLGLPLSTTSITPATVAQLPLPVTATSTNNGAPAIVNATSTSTVTPIVIDVDTSNTATTVTNPIVVSEVTTNEAAPIEVSDGDRSSDEEEDEDEEERIWGRYNRRRHYWDTDTDNEDHDSSEEGNGSDVSIEGVQTEYYGGYGRCFKCGRKGHWANGCPF